MRYSIAGLLSCGIMRHGLENEEKTRSTVH